MKLGAIFPTPESGSDPVAIRDWAQAAEALGYDLIGAAGLEAPQDQSWSTIAGGGPSADWVDRFLFQLCGAIAAGSSNIQRNVIGERGLGLPRDLRSAP